MFTLYALDICFYMPASVLCFSLKKFSFVTSYTGRVERWYFQSLDVYEGQIAFKHFLKSPKENLLYWSNQLVDRYMYSAFQAQVTWL